MLFTLSWWGCVPLGAGGAGYGAQPAHPPGSEAYSACEQSCQHLLTCANANTPADQQSCTEGCADGTPNVAELRQVSAMSCPDALAWLQQRSEQAQASGSGGGAAPAGGACNADCTGCRGDNDSCYNAAMAAMGSTIPCDPCCCAPGGPAPTWNTP